MLKILNAKSPGFEAVVKTDRFKCAFITHAPMYAYGAVREMKRHNLTDEVFVLLSGHATLLIREGEDMKQYPMEPGKAYNVIAGTWHYLGVSEDGMLFVTESSDTDKTNTDTLVLQEVYYLQECARMN